MPERLAGNIAASLLGCGLALLAGESALRLAGYQPWVFQDRFPDAPIMHEPDAVLGWRPLPGTYTAPPYHPSGEPVVTTFLENRSRRTAEASRPEALREIVLVGGSFTHGEAISDQDTFAWKLQAADPSVRVLNFGTGGYGTLQSLLVLERVLPRLSSPAFVLYGFMQAHEARNVAPEDWMYTLASFSRREAPRVPFATLDADGNLIRSPPARYPAWPFRASSALVQFAGRTSMRLLARNRLSQRQGVTEKLMSQMALLSRRHGADCIVVFLHADERVKNRYISFLTNAKVDLLDCSYPLSPDMRVTGEGHPNPRMNTRWAGCIGAALEERMQDVPSAEPPDP